MQRTVNVNTPATRNKKSKKSKKSFLLRILILSAIIYCISIFIIQQVSLNRANDVIAEYNEKILAETDIKARLTNELSEVDTDEYLIQKAREKLGLVRSNERIFVDASKMGNN